MEKIFSRRHLGRDMDTLSLRLCLFGLTNAPTVLLDLMNRVCKPYLDKFLIVFIDDILIYSKSKEDHEVRLKLVLELLKKEKLRIGSKANVVADALSRRERVKPKRVRAMAMTIQSVVKRMILAAQSEPFKEENTTAEMLRGLDQLMKMKEDGDYKMEKLARLYIDEIVAGHGVPVSIISDRDGRFTSRVLANIIRSIGTRLDMGTAYHPLTDGQSERTIQTLEDKLRASPVLWAEIRESELIGPELVQETTDKKCLADANLHVHLEEIKVDKILCFVEEPVEIIDREVKSLKCSRILIVKVHWNLKRGHEDFIKTRYPHMLVGQAIIGSTK
ncbi:putative reverse transcriptase domain-containing protein [Tanacetum coccineum]|uniref:Reverse transcriptase domain-containing protein n=1 Tax=Tanacetum coccineum TaxID=301880 RepID=A0ABQ5DDG2_9ASTR